MPNPRARELRRNVTDAERKLWAHLRLRQIEGHKFRRQRPIGQYIVDFVCLGKRLVIEVDGSQHMQRASADAHRDAMLASLGFRVLRFWDNQVLNEMDAVMEVIAAALREGEEPPSSPSPADGGRDRAKPSPPKTGESQRGGERGQVLTLASIVQRQDGQAAIAALMILLVVSTLILTPLLGQLATGLRKGGNEREQRMKVYAAEAALNRTIADLIRGADGVNTTYTTTEPNTGGSFQTYTITTAYTPPSVTVNNYTPTVTLSLPTASQAKPADQQSYVDPGVTHTNLATPAPGKGYLMRLYNVKAGTLQVNWAYSPAGSAELKIWAGIPASGGAPIPVGLLTSSISVNPTLDSKSATATDTFIRSASLPVNPATDGSGGVYTIMFFNKANTTKTTAAFAPSGGISDTWIYVQARKDYIVTASVGGVSVSAYVRQVPGFNEPPVISLVSGNSYSYTFATNNVSFITSEVSVYTWNSP